MAANHFVDTIEDLGKEELLNEDAIYNSEIYCDYLIRAESDLLGENYTNNLYIIFGKYANIEAKTMKAKMLEYVLNEAEFFESACEKPLRNRGHATIHEWLVKMSKKTSADIIAVFALSVMLNLCTIILSLNKYWCTHFLKGEIKSDTNSSDVVLGYTQDNYFCEFVRRDRRDEKARTDRILHRMKDTDFAVKPKPRPTRRDKVEKPRREGVTTRSTKPKPVHAPAAAVATTSQAEPPVRVVGEIQVIEQPEFRYERRYRFHCVVKECDFVAKSVREWNSHHRIQHKHRKYRCNVCAKVYTTITSMKRHTYTHDIKNYRCIRCNQTFMFKSELARHKKTHQKKGGELCTYAGCNKTYKQKSDLIVHIEAVHKKKKYVCRVQGCATRCGTVKYLKDHMKVHEAAVKCKQCPKTFKHRCSMYRHMKTHDQ